MDGEIVKSAVEFGAVYGAIQAVAQVGMMVFPTKTVAWRFCKWLVSGFARPRT